MGYLEYCSNCGEKNQYGKIDGGTRHYCSKCQTIHYENPRPTTALVCVKGIDILLVQRAVSPGKGLWGLPGGFIERGETPEEGGRRELKEETNLEGFIKGFLGTYSHYNTIWGDILLLGFVIKVNNFSTLCPGDDAKAAQFFSFSDMPSLAFNSHKKFINMYNNSKYAKQKK